MTNTENFDDKVKVNRWNRDEFARRLKIAMKNDSQYGFAKKCEIGESVIRGYLSGNTTPGVDKLLIMSEVAGVSLEWLATGEGPKEKNAYKANDHANTYAVAPTEWTEFVRIPLYNIEASAGHGSALEDEEVKAGMAFRNDWLRAKGLQKDHLAIITAKGDSMEPSIKNGDILLINCLDTKVGEDAIYVIRHNGHLFAKRLQRMFTGELYIKSDNQAYTTQVIAADKATDLNIIGRVVWVGHEI